MRRSARSQYSAASGRRLCWSPWLPKRSLAEDEVRRPGSFDASDDVLGLRRGDNDDEMRVHRSYAPHCSMPLSLGLRLDANGIPELADPAARLAIVLASAPGDDHARAARAELVARTWVSFRAGAHVFVRRVAVGRIPADTWRRLRFK
jgi:hypothetical protein